MQPRRSGAAPTVQGATTGLGRLLTLGMVTTAEASSEFVDSCTALAAAVGGILVVCLLCGLAARHLDATLGRSRGRMATYLDARPGDDSGEARASRCRGRIGGALILRSPLLLVLLVGCCISNAGDKAGDMGYVEAGAGGGRTH